MKIGNVELTVRTVRMWELLAEHRSRIEELRGLLPGPTPPEIERREDWDERQVLGMTRDLLGQELIGVMQQIQGKVKHDPV